jgi:hypothetical protein
MKRIVFIGILLVSGISLAKPVNITGKEVKKPKKRNYKAYRIINFHASAFREGIDWCRTSGGLKMIQLDPNKGYLYRYICNNPKHTLKAGFSNE